MVSVMMAALWSLENLMLSVFFPCRQQVTGEKLQVAGGSTLTFLKVMMNSLFGWLAWPLAAGRIVMKSLRCRLGQVTGGTWQVTGDRWTVAGDR